MLKDCRTAQRAKSARGRSKCAERRPRSVTPPRRLLVVKSCLRTWTRVLPSGSLQEWNGIYLGARSAVVRNRTQIGARGSAQKCSIGTTFRIVELTAISDAPARQLVTNHRSSGKKMKEASQRTVHSYNRVSSILFPPNRARREKAHPERATSVGRIRQCVLESKS